ncbi:hypothetical protein FQN54_006536 [Arachnomyces sp. PD_36]|nr:hypothetical protein FQN54_006536 [Arachnomyces sp. PD_36]
MDDSMIGRWLSELPMDDPTRKRTSKPQLRRFIHHDKPISYRNRLGVGGEGAVFRVRIQGEVYALKIFLDWEYRGPPGLTERQKGYTSPFSHECRAFGRLDSLDENGTWAVKCHGWMKLSDEQYKRASRLELSHLSRWAIVKDYLPDPVSLDDVPEIRSKMSIARRAQLHPEDTLPRNYRGSFLVDLGRVMTYPYPKRIWSNRRRRHFYDVFWDEYVSGWQVSVRYYDSGEVVEGKVNERFKDSIAEEKEAREKERKENGGEVDNPILYFPEPELPLPSIKIDCPDNCG